MCVFWNILSSGLWHWKKIIAYERNTSFPELWLNKTPHQNDSDVLSSWYVCFISWFWYQPEKTSPYILLERHLPEKTPPDIYLKRRLPEKISTWEDIYLKRRHLFQDIPLCTPSLLIWIWGRRLITFRFFGKIPVMGTLDLYFQFLPRNRFFNVFETHLPTLTTGSGFLPMEIRYL